MKTNLNFSLLTLLLYFLLPPFALNAQTGRITTTITVDSVSRTLHYYIPANYKSTEKHTLVIGLHGCDTVLHPGENFRNQIEFLADRLNAIVVCPEGLESEEGFMGSDPAFILAVIDSTVSDYTIDQQYVYLTGFSCNGYTTTTFGLSKIFPFRGILPFNPGYLESDFSDGSFVYTNNVPTCICAGTADPGYNLDLRIRDSLAANKAPFLFNEMPGIGHTTSFPGFQDEMMKCFNYFSVVTSVFENEQENLEVKIYPNPATTTVNIMCSEKINSLELYSVLGDRVTVTSTLNKNTYTLDLSSLSVGIYFVRINYQNRMYSKKISVQ